jgi:hypothetical protein
LGTRVRWDDGERRNFCLAVALLEEKVRILGKPMPFSKMCDLAQKEVILPHRRRPKTSMQKQAMAWFDGYMVEARNKVVMRGLADVPPSATGTKQLDSVEQKQLSGMMILERLEARLVSLANRFGALETVALDVFTSQSSQQAAEPHVADAVRVLKQHHRRIALIGVIGEKEAHVRKEYESLLKLIFLHSKKGHVSVNSVGKVDHVFSIRGLNREAQHAVETETGQKVRFFDDEASLRKALNELSTRGQ